LASAGSSTNLILDSTISGNTATSDDGGIGLGNSATFPFDNLLTVENSTFTNNHATSGRGGGIGRAFGAGIVSVESTIASGNSAAAGGPDLFSMGAVNATTSLIGTIAGITTFNPDAITTLNLGKAPMLRPLAFNGGPTQTHALLPGSPAINNGANPTLLTHDQRGTGFIRSVGIGPDIGAFEVQSPPKVTSVSINGGAVQRSRVTSVAVTFDSLVS